MKQAAPLDPGLAAICAIYVAVSVVPILVLVIGSQVRRREPRVRGDGVIEYPIATMDALNLVVTLLVIVPAALSCVGGIALLGVWLLGRPTRFEVSAEGLRLVWPLRGSELVPASEIVGVERTSRASLGFGVRYGSGGFGGTFGKLFTRSGELRIYSSRLDHLVLVRPARGLPLLLSPSAPDDFVARVDGFRAVR